MNHEREWLSCSCCGGFVANNKRENVSHGVQPYPHDQGYGMCKDCGGDSTSKNIKKQMGFVGRVFVEARFDLVRNNLRPANQERWDGMDYGMKAAVVLKMAEEGLIF